MVSLRTTVPYSMTRATRSWSLSALLLFIALLVFAALTDVAWHALSDVSLAGIAVSASAHAVTVMRHPYGAARSTRREVANAFIIVILFLIGMAALAALYFVHAFVA